MHNNSQNNLWQVVLEHVNDKELIKTLFIENVEELELPYINRLNKWLGFFNENYTKSITIYSTTIPALLEAVKNNKLFKTQTSYEFELSLSFYKLLFDSNIFLKIDSVSDAQLLLNISLIFGKFPGLLRYSILKSITILGNGITKAKLEQFFVQLYVKYENPFFFVENINLLSVTEIEAMMFLLQGNNLSTFDKSPCKISKKESFIIINKIPKNLEVNDNIFLRIIICSKLLLNNLDNDKYLVRFLFHSKTFEHRVETFYEDLDFWKSAFALSCEIQRVNEIGDSPEIVDFFEYHKYHNGINYSLKGKTANSILCAIRDWHSAANFHNQYELIKKDWKGLYNESFNVENGNDYYLFEEITTGLELYKESKSLKHCVFSYIEECSRGKTSIWSMKKQMDDKFKHHITIEVAKSKVVQVKGKHNRNVEESEFHVVKKWASKFNFQLDLEFV